MVEVRQGKTEKEGPAGNGPRPIRRRAVAISEIEKWAASQGAGVSRSKAIRRLVELGLAGSRPIPLRSPKAAAKGLRDGIRANR
jgi:hypothetical protein